jgi:hypothetical protein
MRNLLRSATPPCALELFPDDHRGLLMNSQFCQQWIASLITFNSRVSATVRPHRPELIVAARTVRVRGRLERVGAPGRLVDLRLPHGDD